jgi:amino acid adenylation domain-containing protein
MAQVITASKPVKKPDLVVLDRALLEERDYWLAVFSGDREIARLRPDRPHKKRWCERAGEISLDIDGALWERLRKLTRDSPFLILTTLMAVLKWVLHRYTESQAVTIATPPRLDGERATGSPNAVILRDVVDPGRSFQEFLLQIRTTLLEAYARQRYPLARLLTDLGLEGRSEGCPLFQVALAFEGLHGSMPELGHELALRLERFDEGLRGVVSFAAELYDRSTIERFGRHVLTALGSALGQPGVALREIEMLSAAERWQLWGEWNDTATDYPGEMGLHELFEQQAARRPEAIATAYGEQQLSYRELDRRSNQLGHRLRRLGVTGDGESAVGLCVERCAEMVVASLAILKAGGAYVPIDPTYPPERVAFMLDDTRIDVVVASRDRADLAHRESRLEELPAHHPLRAVQVVIVGGSGRAMAEECETSLGSPGGGNRLAYVTYTSGSTGRPKGVAIAHRGVVRLVRNTDYLRLGPGSRVAQASTTSFDAATFEIWGALLNGGRLEGLAKDEVLSAGKLRQEIGRRRIGAMFLTTALFNQLSQEEGGSFRSLEHLLFGGEAVDPTQVRTVLEGEGRKGGFQGRLLHVYGPTESTTFTTWHRPRRVGRGAHTVPIGRPIANTKVYLVDRGDRPVPVGVVGHLCVGGDGLARGYNNRPGLTAAVFTPHVRSSRPGARLYRSGDLARYRADGAVEFVGRIDQQVKVRGFRIEPGEIEAVLGGASGVRESVVVMREDTPGDKRLVAYVVPEPGTELSHEEVRGFLKARLPAYMIPAAVVELSALPLNANGKVDRQVLPAPGENVDETLIAAPRSPVEEVVAGIYAEVLGREEVGVHDDFFEDLGAHSLLATRVISRLRRVFALELPLHTIFEEPTVAGLSATIERGLRAGRMVEAPPLEPVSRDQALQLSFAQERLWFMAQLEPDSPAYNVPTPLRLEGPLDAAALRRSLSEVVRRHEVLRTSFSARGGEVVQVIAAPEEVALPVVDLGGLGEEAVSRELGRLARGEALRPFDLARGPILRVTLVRLGPQAHAVLATLHHIASDAWSLGIMTREIATLYGALVEGRPSPLPELGIQYADFAAWQRGWLREGALETELTYWRRQLQGSPALLQLPTDRPRPAVQTYRGTSRPFALPAGLSAELGALGRREGATLFMTSLAAFQVLLSRYTGQDAISVGTPIAGRNRVEVEALIGFFLNTLVLRVDLRGDPEFRDLLARVREVSLAAHAHQDLPFEKLVESLEPERNLAHSPLFQALFTVQNAPAESLAVSRLRIQPLEVGTETAKFDLTVLMEEAEEGLRGAVEYNTDLFDATTIGRLVEHFKHLLQGVVSQPRRRLSELELLGAGECSQLLREWNDTDSGGSREPWLPEWFAALAATTSDRVAVVCGEAQVSYRELDRRSSRLAHHLRRRSVGPEVAVAVCLERSPAMVVALLAVLKAGGFYVPLDPGYPDQRLALLLEEDAGVGLILTEERVIERSGRPALAAATAPRLCLDTAWEEIARESVEPPSRAVRPGQLAYQIYTSGSTGRPKGVQITHRALVNFLRSMSLQPGFTAGDVLLAVTTLSFDIAGLELYLPLAMGGRVELVGGTVAADGRQLLRRLATSKTTMMQATPATWRMLEAADWRGSPQLKILCGGEELTPGLAGRLLARGASLWNMYGPTETTIWSLVDRVSAETGTPVSIGRPIANTGAYVLDARGRPLPIGALGELLIGGAGLARGYFRRPAMTAEKFLPDDCSGQRGERLYRTGDRVRWRPDGDLEFWGRIDHQLKVRGFRIEPGEVEVALAQHPGIEEAVVMARHEGPGDFREAGGGGPISFRLVGYVTPSGQGVPASGELRHFLAERLPDYMVPSLFIELKSLPRLPNGKVDRGALPPPGDALSTPRGTFVAPRGPSEELLAEIWSDLLGIEGLGVYDNFFELGGHSLLATQMFSRVVRAFRIELPLRALFEAPTIAGLAARVNRAMESAEGWGPPPMVPAPRDGALGRKGLPLSFAQQRMWFLDQLEPGNPAYNVPAALRLEGPLRRRALQLSLSELVRRHEVLCTSYHSVDGEPVQVTAPPEPVPFPVVNLEQIPDRQRSHLMLRLARVEAQRPFDLVRGPVWRALLLRLGEEDHAMLVTLHHIASDGWSLGILMRELATLYGAFVEGRPSPLPELEIQYPDYATWQRGWLRGEELAAQLDYWRKRLKGAPPLLQMPADRPRPAVQTHRGTTRTFVLPADLSAALLVLGRKEGATPFMTLLAAFQALLARYTSQDDISVGTPIAGRNRLEIEGLIGFFVNTLVLRTDLSGNPTFRSLLARVREIALEAHAHQELPFEKLVEELEPERSLAHSPLFQVMFLLENTPREAVEGTGLRISRLEAETMTANFDLTLAMTEEGEVLIGEVEYNTELFDSTTIQRFQGHLRSLLATVVSQPERHVFGLPLLAGAQRSQVVVEWNDTGKAYSRDRCIHELFEDQVARTPDQPAVEFGGARLTYRQLNERSNRLARHLQAVGAGPEVVVGICLERSLELVVGLFGILKSGAAYLPLDPSYPQERRAFMMHDAQASLLLTRRSLAKIRLPERVKVVLLSQDEATLRHESGESTLGRVGAENPAYVIYTSGSTGNPKGVLVAHGSLVNYIESRAEELALQPEDRMLQFASSSFDTSAEEIFSCLTRGARLVLRSESMPGSVAEFLRSCEELGLTVLDLPTAYWHEVTAALCTGCLGWPRCVRQVIIGGEAALPDRWAAWRNRVGREVRLFNTYGPTEATIVAIACELSRLSDPEAAGRAVPLGRAIANARVYPLDRELSAVPMGLAGELHIGGVPVARGYLHRPRLTAEKFIPDPIGDRPGGRLYKTGDLTRHRADGNLEFLGRVDDQVKVRGFRIELGEIAAVLGEHPAVREVEVLAPLDASGDRRLQAYLVTDSEVALSAGALDAALAGRLPDYMIPSVFVFLEALPRTPSGKLDRRALAGIKPEMAGGHGPTVAPRDALELELVQIWEELLDTRPIGVTDDFFARGGHSLLAVRLMACLERRLGRALPVAALFQHSTVEALAAALRHETEPLAQSSLVALQPGGSATPFFCVHPVGGNVFCYVELARHLGPEQPFYALQALGLDGSQQPLSRVEEMAAHYLETIRGVQPQGPYLLGGWSVGGLIAFEMARQLQARGQEVGLLVLMDSRAQQPHDELEEGGDLEPLAIFALDLGLSLDRLALSAEELGRLSTDEKLALVLEEAKAAKKLPPEVGLPEARHLFRVFESTLIAEERYDPRPYPGQVYLFRARDGSGKETLSSDLGWGRYAQGGVTVEEISGDHFSFLQQPHVAQLAERLEVQIANRLGSNSRI